MRRRASLGIGVLEVVISLSIVAVVIGLTIQIFRVCLIRVSENGSRLQALRAAEGALEWARSQPLSELPPLRVAVAPRGNKPYIVSFPTAATSARNVNAKLSVRVEWADGTAFDGKADWVNGGKDVRLTGFDRAGILYISYAIAVPLPKPAGKVEMRLSTSLQGIHIPGSHLIRFEAASRWSSRRNNSAVRLSALRME